MALNQARQSLRLLWPSPARHHLTSVRARVFSTTTNASNNDQPLDANTTNPNISASTSTQKLRILRAAIDQVKTHGWTREAIVAAVHKEYPNASLSLAGIVPSPQALVAFCMDDWNARLKQELEQQQETQKQQEAHPNHTQQNSSEASPSGSDKRDNNNDNTVDRIVFALQRRLEYQKELIQCRQWHQGMAMGLSTPQQTTQQLKELIQTVVTHASHNKPNNLSELSLIALGAVYVSTELHMLADSSIEYEDTWSFLRQRVQEWHSTIALLSSTTTSINNSSSSSTSSSTNVLPFLPSLPAPDTMHLVSTVATAVASGVLSVVQVDLKRDLPQNVNEVWKAATAQTTTTRAKDGSNPKDYETASQ